MNRFPRKLLLIITLSVVLIAIGHSIVIQRKPDGLSPWTRLTPDALQYISMASGSMSSPPFSYRVLVPYLASLLPMPPDLALRLITYLCLGTLYFSSLFSLTRLGFAFPIKLASILCLFASTGHLYMYSNPYLTDAFGLMSLSIMLYALFVGNSTLFAITTGIGVLARETTLFLVPAFLITKQWRTFIVIVFISFAAFITPRLLIIDDGSHQSFVFPSNLTYFVQIYLTFGVLWIPMFLGLAMCNRNAFPAISTSFACLLLGALLTSTLATDTIRMFAIMLPIGALCWAYYFEGLWHRCRGLALILLIFVLTGIPLALPTSFLPKIANEIISWEDFYFRLKYPVAIFHAIGFTLAIASAFILKQELAAGTHEKLDLLWSSLCIKSTKKLRLGKRLSNKRP
ncbi:MAG: hypothetical protein QHH26_01015 [Armatimonadota bacterium]|nr:hypothetical protein [Armatimonadota bacterium]